MPPWLLLFVLHGLRAQDSGGGMGESGQVSGGGLGDDDQISSDAMFKEDCEVHTEAAGECRKEEFSVPGEGCCAGHTVSPAVATDWATVYVVTGARWGADGVYEEYGVGIEGTGGRSRVMLKNIGSCIP